MEIVDNSHGVGGGVEFCFDNLEFEFPHVLWEIVIVVDSGIGEPSGGFCSGVGTLEIGRASCRERVFALV